MKTLSLPGFVLGCLLLSGCAGTNNVITLPPGSVASDSIRVGDKITVRLTGVPPGEDYINEIQIPESGEITLPELTQSFHAAGMLPGALANQISTAYRDSKIFTNPNVTVIPEERFVNVSGDVRGPTRVLYTPDLTLLSAITSCGGFDEYANKHSVRIIRGSQIYHVDATKAMSTPGQDPAVYPGDQISFLVLRFEARRWRRQLRAVLCMMVRTFFLPAVLSALALMVTGCSSSLSSDPAKQQQQVQQVFDGLKDSLALAHGRTALGYLDGPTLDFLNGVATKPSDPSAPDVNELIRRVMAKLTPGGIQPGFTLKTPVQHVLDAGWISPSELDGLRLGPVTLEAGQTQARAELFWLGNPTTVQLQFIRDSSGAWKIDLLNLLPYGEAAMRTERAFKNETATQQIDRLVAQIPNP